MEIRKFWDEALSYDDYVKHGEDIIEDPQTEQEKAYLKYYELGLRRMKRMMKTYKPLPEQVEARKKKNFTGKILVISEPWCGDASNAVPVVQKLFTDSEMRITLRDQDPSLIDDFLTNGKSRSIPIVIFLTSDFEVIGHWGPRPIYGKQLFEKHLENPEEYSEEQLHNDLQVFYAKNKGVDTAEEMLALL